MTVRFLILYFCCLSSLIHANELSTLDDWTRSTDQRSIKAYLISFDLAADQVTLKMKNGKVHNIKFSILIPEHQSRLKKLDEKMQAQKKEAANPRMESFTPKGGGDHKIHIYKPAGYIDHSPSSKSRPIAFLYSANGNSKIILDRMKATSDELGWVLVGIDAYKNTKSITDRYEERMNNTKIAYQWAVENLSFDPNKIVFGGMSGGAWWSYQSASELTQQTAGILAFGGWMGNMHEKKYSKKMAVALVNGDKDKNAISYEKIDGDFLKSKTRAKVKAFHFQGGHTLAPSTVALEAARWIHETKKFDSP